MYYIGFLKKNTKHAVIFMSAAKPRREDYTYFVNIVGPFESEGLAKNHLRVLTRSYGVHENPIKDVITKERIRKAIALTKKVIRVYKEIRKDNPGKDYHDKKFAMYMKELERYGIGSVLYAATLARAYEHLKSAQDS